jgi:hypothetical protein
MLLCSIRKRRERELCCKKATPVAISMITKDCFWHTSRRIRYLQTALRSKPFSLDRRCESTAVYGHCQAPTTTCCILREFSVTNPGQNQICCGERANAAPTATKTLLGSLCQFLFRPNLGNKIISRHYAFAHFRTRNKNGAKGVETCGNCGNHGKARAMIFGNQGLSETTDSGEVLFQEQRCHNKSNGT